MFAPVPTQGRGTPATLGHKSLEYPTHFLTDVHRTATKHARTNTPEPVQIKHWKYMRLYRYGEPMHKQETENNSDFHTMRMGSFQYGFDSLAPLLVWLGIACVMVASGPSMGANFTKLIAPCFVLYRTGAMRRTCDKGMPCVLSPYKRKGLSTRCCPCSSRHCSSVSIWKAWPRCALPYNVWVPDIRS